ncbi:MAG: hypothetical protein MMC23_001703 [Stictis urceolatum]|nr:hypothetical protein [Stictis urceolata]
MATQPPPGPPLTPTLCLTPTGLSLFLSRSRALTDDTISQNLSALSTPSLNPFRINPTGRQPSTSRLPNSACGTFIAGNLFPNWAERDRVLKYCEGVADGLQGRGNTRNQESGPAEDRLEGQGVEGTEGMGAGWSRDEAEAYAREEGMRRRGEALVYEYGAGEEEEPDERLDPYSARVERPEEPAEVLRRVLRGEREVEDIVRRRSWGVVKDRCTGVDGAWEEIMRSWGRE